MSWRSPRGGRDRAESPALVPPERAGAQPVSTSGRYRVDAVAGAFDGERLDQRDLPALGRRVVRVERLAALAGGRADDDDRARSPAPERRDRRPAEPPRAAQVDVEGLPPLFGSHAVDRRALPDARVGDRHVDAAPRLLGLADEPRDLLVVGDVGAPAAPATGALRLQRLRLALARPPVKTD